MITRLLKWGNSFAVRIPKAFANEMKMAENSSIEMTMKEGALQIAPIAEERWDLDELLEGVTAENRHGEWETGPAEGNELW